MNEKLHKRLIDRAKQRLGGKFYHYASNKIVLANDYDWEASRYPLGFGLTVSCGHYIVWSATRGWLAEAII